MIKKYSVLKIESATEEEQKENYLKIFETRANKRKAKGESVIFDPDIVKIDIERWMYQKKIGNTNILKQIEQYKTHEDLHESVKNYKSKIELEHEKEYGTKEVEGKEFLFSIEDYSVFKATTVPALTMLAQNSNWCVRYPQAAKDYLETKGSTFYIVLKGKERYVAIRETKENTPNVEVWWYTDYELRNGTSYADFTADLMQSDVEIINKILSKLGFNPIVAGETFEVYSNIQDYLDKMRSSGEFKRFLYNQRFYPELANKLFTPGMKIKGYLDLSGTPITSLPENLSVGGGLYLRGTPITSLPSGLSVGGNLDLRGTAITTLPENLSVGRSLYLSGTPITSLPSSLIVKGSIFGTNPKTKKKYQDEYKEMKSKKTSATLRKLKII